MSFDQLATIVSNTPLWAWAVLALLVAVGVHQLRDRTMNWLRLLLMPVVVSALAVSGFLATGASLAAIAGLGFGAAAGSVAAAAVERRDGAVKLERGAVRIRGGWLTLAVLLGAFFTRYVSIVVATIDPPTAGAAVFQFVAMFATGTFAAFTLARAALRLRVAFS